jgi:hypothetical protein
MRCGFCHGTTFALSTVQPSGAKFPIAVVCCASCDVPIGILQQEDPLQTILTMERSLSNRMKQLEDQVSRLWDRLPSAP